MNEKQLTAWLRKNEVDYAFTSRKDWENREKTLETTNYRWIKDYSDHSWSLMTSRIESNKDIEYIIVIFHEEPWENGTKTVGSLYFKRK